MKQCENCGRDSEAEYCEPCNKELLDEQAQDKRDRDKWQG
jgi:uncharacterized membrane protein YvbJ